MSEDWPRGWYNDEPDQPGAAGQRAQPSFTPGSRGQGSPGQGSPGQGWQGWGQGSRGQGSPGQDSRAQGSRGQGSRGQGSPGQDSRAQGSRGQGSRGQGSPGQGSRGQGWHDVGPGDTNAAEASVSAWPAQPPPRSSWTGGAGGPGGRGFSGRRGRRWLRPRRILAILVALVALAVLATVAVYFSVSSKLTRINVLVPTSFTTAGTNWLIAGSDSRGGLTTAQENQLALGHDITGGRSDTIMLLHLPANGNRPTLVSLPRDSYVAIPGNGYNKLNAAYAIGGPKLLIATVQNATRLHIDHFMSIGFGGLVNVVNDVGGVRMCLKAPMKDPEGRPEPQGGMPDPQRRPSARLRADTRLLRG